DVIKDFTMEERMTVCNMSIEAGARAGLISPDEKTVDYLRHRRHLPKGEDFEKLAEEWLSLATDEGAEYDKVLTIRADEIEPQVTWGTNPAMGAPITGTTPNLSDVDNQEELQRALDYMGLEPGQSITSIEIDHVF